MPLVRRLEQRLRGNAADIQAGAAQGAALLDAGGLEAELGRTDGGDITARAAADDDDVEIVLAHLNPIAG
jgi:hypothetical protein